MPTIIKVEKTKHKNSNIVHLLSDTSKDRPVETTKTRQGRKCTRTLLQNSDGKEKQEDYPTSATYMANVG